MVPDTNKTLIFRQGIIEETRYISLSNVDEIYFTATKIRGSTHRAFYAVLKDGSTVSLPSEPIKYLESTLNIYRYEKKKP